MTKRLIHIFEVIPQNTRKWSWEKHPKPQLRGDHAVMETSRVRRGPVQYAPLQFSGPCQSPRPEVLHRYPPTQCQRHSLVRPSGSSHTLVRLSRSFHTLVRLSRPSNTLTVFSLRLTASRPSVHRGWGGPRRFVFQSSRPRRVRFRRTRLLSTG